MSDKSILQRLKILEHKVRALSCCNTTPSPGGAGNTYAGYIQFVVGLSGLQVIFDPYAETPVAFPAAGTTLYTLADLANYEIVVHLNGYGYLVESLEYNRTAGDTELNRIGGFQYEDKEIYTIFLIPK